MAFFVLPLPSIHFSVFYGIFLLLVCLKTAILSWLQKDGSRGFSVDQLKRTFGDVSNKYSSCLSMMTRVSG